MTDESAETVDRIADRIDIDEVEEEAERLGLKPDELLRRVLNELQARLTGLAA